MYTKYTGDTNMANANAVLTTRVPVKLKKELELLAEETHRPKAWLVVEALQAFIDLNRWQIGAIKKGLVDAKEGRVVEHKAVADWLDTWGTPSEKARPK
jgi:predicted transcriptional regulator